MSCSNRELDLSVMRFKIAFSKMQLEASIADKWKQMAKQSSAKRALLLKQNSLRK